MKLTHSLSFLRRRASLGDAYASSSTKKWVTKCYKVASRRRLSAPEIQLVCPRKPRCEVSPCVYPFYIRTNDLPVTSKGNRSQTQFVGGSRCVLGMTWEGLSLLDGFTNNYHLHFSSNTIGYFVLAKIAYQTWGSKRLAPLLSSRSHLVLELILSRRTNHSLMRGNIENA